LKSANLSEGGSWLKTRPIFFCYTPVQFFSKRRKANFSKFTFIAEMLRYEKVIPASAGLFLFVYRM
jgi:hypothetical protein